MKKRILTQMSFLGLLILLMFPFQPELFAQKVDMDQFKSMKARSVGPAAMSGRITAIDVAKWYVNSGS